MRTLFVAVLLSLVPAATNSADFPEFEPLKCDGANPPNHKVKLPSGIFIPAHRFYWEPETKILHVVGVDPVRIFCSGF